MFCHRGAEPGAFLQRTQPTHTFNHRVIHTRCHIFFALQLNPLSLLSSFLPSLFPPPLLLTVDVVDEACRPWYVVHLGAAVYLFVFAYFYVPSSHECFKICFFKEEHTGSVFIHNPDKLPPQTFNPSGAAMQLKYMLFIFRSGYLITPI